MAITMNIPSGDHYVVLGQKKQATQIALNCEMLLKAKKSFFGLSTPRGSFDLEIDCNVADSGLLIDEPGKFITFEDGSNRLHVDIDSTKYPFKLLLDPRRIVDCAGNQDSMEADKEGYFTFAVGCDLTVKDGKNEPQHFAFSPTIHVERVAPKLEVELKMETTELDWHAALPGDGGERSVRVGYLSLRHAQPLGCAPGLNIDVNELTACASTGDKAEVFLKPGELNETHFRSEQSVVGITRGDVSILEVAGPNTSAPYYQVKRLYATDGDRQPNEVRIPLYWTMPGDNPDTDLEYAITARLAMSANREGKAPDGLEICETGTLKLRRNTQLTELRVRAGLATGLHTMRSGETVTVSEEMEVAEGQPGDYRLRIEVRNMAQAPSGNASLLVGPLTLLPLRYADAPEQWRELAALYEEDEQEEFEALLRKSVERNDLENPQRLTYAARPDPRIVEVRLPNNRLLSFLDKAGKRDMTLELPFEFNYRLDTDGACRQAAQDGRWDEVWRQRCETFGGVLRLNVCRKPKPAWVSVDFGTSAIVAAIGLGNQITLVDLRESKMEKVLRPCFPDEPEKIKEDETGQMISSVTALNPAGKEAFDDELGDLATYKGLPLWLSPSPSMVAPGYQLPCLKYLATTRTLPDGEYQAFAHYDLSGHSYTRFCMGDTTVGIEPVGLGDMQNVFDTVYRQLLKLFIKPALGGQSFNKMVLTIPNTFTPLHERNLKRVAEAAFPDVWPKHLCFVSESDAVAYHYAYQRQNFLKSVDTDTKQRLNQCERVLVFDMGAGTLDLTYFERRNTAAGQQLDIKGKMGVSKAGDYLDHELATVIIGLMREDLESGAKANVRHAGSFDGLLCTNAAERARQGVEIQGMRRLKEYVKRQVKPLLNDATGTLPPYFDDSELGGDPFFGTDGQGSLYSDPFAGIELSRIVRSRRYQNFISDCTQGTLDTFFRLFHVDPAGVDIVIFSGRSATLNDIRLGVANCFGKDTWFADIMSGKMVRKEGVSLPRSVRNTDMKTIVARGAIAAMNLLDSGIKTTHLEIYASYGAVLHDRADAARLVWRPLFDIGRNTLRDTPDDNDNRYDSEQDGGYTERVNGREWERIEFVQCFSENPQADLDAGNFTRMTRLYEYVMDANMATRLLMQVDHDMNINFLVGGLTMEARSQASINFNDPDFRKSLWPVLLK